MKRNTLLLLILTICAPVFGQTLIDESMAKPETKTAFKAFKPGPKVKAALDDLEQQGRDLLARYRDGHVDERTLMRERGRREIAAFTIKAWAFTHKTDEVATIAVVIVGSPEFYQIFPRGTSHLPSQLQPKAIYQATPDASILWQFVGQRESNGTKFAIFRRADLAKSRID